MKRIGILLLALCCAVCAMTISALAADEPATFDHNINYADNLSANRYKVSADSSDAWIDLGTERLYAADGVNISGISYDGGNKWKTVVVPAEGLDLTKAFNKPTSIVLATQMNGKKPRLTASADGSEPAGKLIKFPSISGRPKIDKFIVNYLVGADDTGATNGRWVLTLKDSSRPLTGYQVAPSLNKKTPDTVMLDTSGKVSDSGTVEASWGSFSLSGSAQGVSIIGLTESGKQQKLNYVVRVAPNAQTRTPASKVKKITVAGVGKKVVFKADYKKEIIKLKENGMFFEGDLAGLGQNTTKLSRQSKDEAKAGTQLGNMMEKTACMWIAATVKKPATAAQEVTFAARGMMKETELKVASGKTSVSTKEYEIYDPAKKKWGSLPKLTGACELGIRIKATAKGGKESDDTKFAASEEGKLVIDWGEYTKGKSGVIGAAIIAPEYTGVFRYSPDKTVYIQDESDTTFTVTFEAKGLYSGDTLVLKATGDTLTDVAAGEVWIRPKVNYKNTGAAEDSITYTASLSDGKLKLEVMPELACEATIELEYALGTHSPVYDADNSGGRAAVIKVNSVGETVKLNSMKPAYLDDGVRISMTTAATSGTTPRRAKVVKGTAVISSDGQLQMASKQDLSGYTSFTYAASDKDEALPEESVFTSDAVEVSHEGYLFVKAEGQGKSTIYFAYELKDASGARMKSAAFSGDQVIVTLDEPLSDSAETGGASIVLEGWGVGQATRSYVTNIALSADKKQMTMTLDDGFAMQSGAKYVLTYSGATQSDVLSDRHSNAMQPGSVPVGSISGVDRVRFENGLMNTPVDVVAPEPVSSLSALTTDNIYSISLAGSNTGMMIVDGATSVQYARSNTLMATEMTMNSFTNGTVVSGLSVGDYLYVKADGKYYVFQVAKNSLASTTDTTRPLASSAALIKSEATYTATLTANEALLKFGLGPRPEQFRIDTGTLNNIAVSKVAVSGTKITLTLTGSDLSGIANGDDVKITYNTGRNGISDANGNRVLAFNTVKLTLSGFSTASPLP